MGWRVSPSASPSTVRIFFPSIPDGEKRTGIDRLAVNIHGAGAAVSAIAGFLRPCQPEFSSQDLKQGPVRFDLETVGPVVDVKLDDASFNPAGNAASLR